MGILNLFSKKKKKSAQCALTGTILYNGEGCLVTTSEVVMSKKFWESIMTEPETMAYTINHFTKKDKQATMMRNAIFEKYAEREEPWVVSEDCLQTYGIVTSLNGTDVKKWWDTDGKFKPSGCGKARQVLAPELYEEVRQYAVMSAGSNRVPAPE
jgi:hypothetical protein